MEKGFVGMEAGKLDRRVRIERAAAGAVSLGHAAAVWSEIATVWAGWQAVSDGERNRGEVMAAGGIGSTITDRFTIRYSETVEDVGPRDRLIYAGRIYDIQWVKETGRREGLEISATAVLA